MELKFPDGSKERRHLKNITTPIGPATRTFPDGAVLKYYYGATNEDEGVSDEGVSDGPVTWNFPDGTKTVGTFWAGQLHGTVVTTQSDGSTRFEVYREGKKMRGSRVVPANSDKAIEIQWDRKLSFEVNSCDCLN